MIGERLSVSVLIGVATLTTAAACAEDRLPTIPPAQYSTEQKQAAADFEAARKLPVVPRQIGAPGSETFLFQSQ